jgi:C-3',4' desaturase CrtD
MNQKKNQHEVIVIGAGMGGLTAAALLAKDGYKVTVLEASHVAGGCSSSYYRKGYIFESGATTLIGFDEHQPLRRLEDHLGIEIPKKALSPSMSVYLDGRKITRWQNRERWVNEAVSVFGEKEAQHQFWKKAFDISDVVWKVSGKNPFFPPSEPSDWLTLFKNNPLDARILPYALKSVKQAAIDCGISNPGFFRFLDEQLIISAQSLAHETPFIFGAPAVTYTNYTNYSVPGGLVEMVNTITGYIESMGGRVLVKEKVMSLGREGENFKVFTSKKRSYTAETVISNIPVWNMSGITSGAVRDYFDKEASKYEKAWGAFTMGVVTDDLYDEEMTLHHQIVLDETADIPGLDSGSLFVSFSARGDHQRAPEGNRVLNISAHAYPEFWFGLNGDYEAVKQQAEAKIIELLKDRLPGFVNAEIKLAFSATPVSWSNWVYRKKGRVGGIPQSMSRSLLDWTPNQTPFEGLYLCGDTVYPGQGIPGVTLSGFNVYYRVKKNHKNKAVH